MLAEVIFKRSARTVADSSEETLIAPTATLVAVMVRNPRRAINFAIGGSGTGALLFQDSIVNNLGVVTLENDTAFPEVQQYYGTDSGGVRGYHNLPSVPSPTGTYLISGGGVIWSGTGFVYHVAEATYRINGASYASPATDVTLAASDPTDDRIDVIAVDDNNTAVVITGTPGGPPVQPAVDPSSQLMLTFIYVPAASTIPVITTQDIYHENTEWTTSVTAGTINPASTSNPYTGTKDIEATAAASGNAVQLVKPTGSLNLADYTSLSFWIRSKSSWPSQKSLSIWWMMGTSTIGTSVALRTGVYGFNSATTGVYQLIIIPVSAFGTGATPVDRLRMTVSGGGSTIGWYIDDIILQTGGGGGGTGNGDFSTNTAVSVAGEVVVFADTTGKLGKRGVEGTDYLAPARISDAAYDATTWNGDTTHAPSKNAVRDKLETLASPVDDTAYDATTWNGDTTHAPSKNAVRDKFESLVGGGGIGNFAFGLKRTSGIAVGKIAGYWACPFAGTITGWNLAVDTGTITVKIWKIARGTAHPTNANSINTSGLALSTGTAIHSTTLTDFTTTTVTVGDIFAVEVTAVGGSVTDFGGSIEITKP